jgi:drug/metabolite transporter (DMT)-like permease
MEKREVFKYIIGALVIIGFFTLLIFLLFLPIPEVNSDLLNLVVGALIGCFGTIVTYNFGSSAGSADKARTIGKIAEAKNLK